MRIIDYEEIPTLRFDFINTEQVFEHLAEPRETLAHLRQSLKAGGILKISVPDGGDIRQRLEKWNWQAPKTSRDSLNPVAPLEHINCFKRDSLVRLACECDLIPSDVQPATMQMCPVGVKQTMKAILRPYWQRLRKARPQPSLSLYFRAAES